jgi:carboxypeptidase PM20D1
MFHTTIAPTMLTGSPKENVLPQSATALINYRIAPWDNSAKVIERARAAVKGLPVTVEWTDIKPREPTPVSSTNSPGWKMIVASARADRPGMAFSPYLVVGGTDSRNMTAISDDVYRFMPIEIATKDIKLLHGTNEHISLKNLENQIRFFARLIATSAG